MRRASGIGSPRNAAVGSPFGVVNRVGVVGAAGLEGGSGGSLGGIGVVDAEMGSYNGGGGLGGMDMGSLKKVHCCLMLMMDLR